MTAREAYNAARKALSAVTEDAAFDAACLTEHFLGVSRAALLAHGDRILEDEPCRVFFEAVSERAGGRPLQYILGKWEFMGLSLFCGEGVLIPREDTAVLVEAAAPYLAPGACGLDLCAGTGAVALALAKKTGAKITAVEKFPEAMGYLEKNVAQHAVLGVRAVEGDVLSADFAEAMPTALDFIVSNPPYIEAGELLLLQREVQREPKTALDGGADGLVFYRALVGCWARKLKPGGLLAVEIGETQGEQVRSLFEAAGLVKTEILPDTAGLPRVVRGFQKQEA